MHNYIKSTTLAQPTPPLLNKLILSGADLFAPDKIDGTTPFHILVGIHQFVPAFREVLQHVTPQQVNCKYEVIEKTHHELNEIAIGNFIQFMVCFLDDFIRTGYGDTPLLVAARNKNYDWFQFLLDHGADINSRGAYGQTGTLYSFLTWIQCCRSCCAVMKREMCSISTL